MLVVAVDQALVDLIADDQQVVAPCDLGDPVQLVAVQHGPGRVVRIAQKMAWWGVTAASTMAGVSSKLVAAVVDTATGVPPASAMHGA